MLAPWKKSYDKPRQHIKKQRHHSLAKIHIVKAMVFPVVMHGCESWTIKKVEPEELMLLNYGAGEDSRESLGQQGGQTSQSKGNQPWKVTGRTDASGEAPILCPPDVKSWLIGKDPGAGKDWRQEEKGTTEDEMVGCFNGPEFEQTPGDSEGQRSLVCYSPWGHKKSDRT